MLYLTGWQIPHLYYVSIAEERSSVSETLVWLAGQIFVQFFSYMWSDTISSGPTDIGPPDTRHARQTETPDIYEFRFFAFAKS